MNSENLSAGMSASLANGLLTSLHIPRERSTGCFMFVAALVVFSIFVVAFVVIIIALNANKIFENIGNFSLPPTMQMIENDVPQNVRLDFSNAYLNIFLTTDKNILLNPQPWKIKALNYVSSSVKDRKISCAECEELINIVNSSSTNKYE